MNFPEKPLILIVDDRPTNLKLLFSLLKESGYKVLVAKDGESALEKLQEVLPDLILLDVMMPGLDGFEICHRLKASLKTKDIPVIFMTAITDLTSKVRGLSVGAVDYITKPFQQEEVLARVKLHLQLRSLTKTLEEQNVLLKQEIEGRMKAEASLQQFAEELERRVAERTAQLTQALSNLQQTQVQLEVERGKLQAVLQQMPAGVVIAEAPSGKLILGNEQSEEILGPDFLSLDNLASLQSDSFQPDAQSGNSLEVPLARAIATGEVTMGEEINFQRSDGTYGTLRISCAPIRNSSGEIVAGVETFYDITDSKQTESKLIASLEEKEVLLKEIHHRVKNNLQIISSLLNLQAGYVTDESILEIFKESESRIFSMALIHEKLYQSDNLKNIELCDYIEDLSNSLLASYENRYIKINIEIETDERIYIGVDTAVPCGLIINELVLNALKHAFVGRDRGSILISVVAGSEGKITLIVRDNGRGLPEGIDWENSHTLGFQLVIVLTRQLEGEIEIDREGGTEVKICFKI